MLAVFFALVVSAFAQPTGPDAADRICVDSLPSTPVSLSPARSARKQAKLIDNGYFPNQLVPLAYLQGKPVRPTGMYVDGDGNVYRYRDVEHALLTHPASSHSYWQFRFAEERGDSGRSQVAYGQNESSKRFGDQAQAWAEIKEGRSVAKEAKWAVSHHFTQSLCAFNRAQSAN